jgi:hypothetical protein
MKDIIIITNTILTLINIVAYMKTDKQEYANWAIIGLLTIGNLTR